MSSTRKFTFAQGEPELPKQDSLPRFVKLKKVLAK